MVLGLLVVKVYEPIPPFDAVKPYHIYLLLLLPFLEELAFRLPLTLKRVHVLISGFLMGLFGVVLGLKYYGMTHAIAVLFGLVICMFISWLSYNFHRTKKTRLFVFYISAVLFSLIHFYNYSELPLGAYILIFIPHFLSGIIFGFFRLRFSIGHSIMMHYLVNLFPFIVFVVKNHW